VRHPVADNRIGRMPLLSSSSSSSSSSSPSVLQILLLLVLFGFEWTTTTTTGCLAFGTGKLPIMIAKIPTVMLYRRISSSNGYSGDVGDGCGYEYQSTMMKMAIARSVGRGGGYSNPSLSTTVRPPNCCSYPWSLYAFTCRCPTYYDSLSLSSSSSSSSPYHSSCHHHSLGQLSSKVGGDHDDGNNDDNTKETTTTTTATTTHYGSINNTNNNTLQPPPPQQQQPSTGQQILSLAIPALAGLALDPILTLVDTAFIGRTATTSDALAGVGSAAALETFAFYIFNFLCTATTPLLSQRRASGDEEGAAAVGGQALTLATVIGVILAGVLIFFRAPLLEVMGTGQTGEEANAYADSFLQIRALAAPAVFIASASTGILRGYLDTKTAFVILAVANVVNFGLDVVLIVGLGLGPTGAAIATTVAEWIAAVAFLGVLGGVLPSVDEELGRNQRRRSKRVVVGVGEEEEGDEGRLMLMEQSLLQDGTMDGGEEEEEALLVITPTAVIPSWQDIKPLIIASSSLFLRSVVLQLALAGGAAMAARTTILPIDSTTIATGTTTTQASASVAAHQIALQLWLLGSFICDALAAASQALISDALGRSDPHAVRAISRTIFTYALGLGVFLALALGIGETSGFLRGVFTQDSMTQAALAPLLTLLVIAQPLNSLVFAADGILQGASEFGYQAKAMAVSVGVAVLSFEGLEYFGVGGVAGVGVGENTLLHVWYSLLVLQVVRGIASFVKLVDKDAAIDLFGS